MNDGSLETSHNFWNNALDSSLNASQKFLAAILISGTAFGAGATIKEYSDYAGLHGTVNFAESTGMTSNPKVEHWVAEAKSKEQEDLGKVGLGIIVTLSFGSGLPFARDLLKESSKEH